MEDEDIEYDITFPSPYSGIDENDDSILDEYVIEGDVKEPVVILIGWAGCKDKHLAKYCQIYEKRCITIRYIPPTNITYLNPKLLNGVAHKVLDLVCDFNLEANPIFFHIFSNNGSFIYTEITKILTSREGHKYGNFQVKGTIIDSAPGKRRITRAAWAFVVATGQRGFFRYFMYVGMICYLFFLRIYYFCTMLTQKENETNPYNVYRDMKEDKTKWPQLFIFSDSDNVILAQDILELVEYRRDQLGVAVDILRYDNSDHVAHYRSHPESYAIQCNAFIDQQLPRYPVERNTEETVAASEDFE